MTEGAVITARPVRGDEDFWRVRDLLVRTVPTAPMGHNWDLRRWESKYFYNPAGRWEDGWEQSVRLWETVQGELVGCVCREGTGEAWIQIEAAYRFLEPEMIEWAEAFLAVQEDQSSTRSLEFLVFEYDALRQRLLAERGYQKMPYGGMLRHLRLPATPLPECGVVPPYMMREVEPADGDDCQRIADLLNAAFHRSFHNAAEFRSFATLAPSYVNELDLVAVAPDGSFAAYVAMPYDEVNRRGIFEPVCTHPDHQRRGLASALMREALHRVQAMGAMDATVDTGDMVPANALYDSLGFTESYKAFAWRRSWSV